MERNQEYIARARMAEHYTSAARSYIMEALYMYLEWRQEQELANENPSSPADQPGVGRGVAEPRAERKWKEINEYLNHLIQTAEFGCLSMLWQEAISWITRSKDDDPFADSGIAFVKFRSFRPTHFHGWWVRAALARGHAEWLLKERIESHTVGHPTPIEGWRLLPPGTVGQYDNSCLVWSTLFVLHHRERHTNGDEDYDFDVAYERDVYYTKFNTLSDEMRGKQSLDFGWPVYSFLYGAPVSTVTSRLYLSLPM